MAGLIAPINMVPESGREIAEQIKSSVLGPVQQGSEYQSLLGQQPGLNLGPDLPKLVMGLMRLLGVADPSGFVGGPAGLVYGKGVSPIVKALGKSAEEFSPALKAMTGSTPVKQMGIQASRPGTVAEYLSSSPLRPAGTINLYGEKDPSAILEEMAHRLAEHPTAKDLMRDMWFKAPVGIEKSLTATGYRPSELREEYFAKSIASMVEEGLGKSPSKLAKIITTISDIKAPPEMKGKILEFLKSVPENKQQETMTAITGVFDKAGVGSIKESKSLSTSKKLEQIYNDIATLDSEYHPIRSRIEDSPFVRTRFTNELKTRISSFDDSPLKNKLMKEVTTIGDPKDPKSVVKLEVLAENVHATTRMQAAKYESLLETEFGKEDAHKIIDKLWDKVYEEKGPVGGPAKFSKLEPIGRTAVKEQKDALKNKDIQDVIREEIGRVIQRPGKGGVISSRKGGGMIVNKPGELGQYLDEAPRPKYFDPETGARTWEF
jgi:hypothetical protein